jgi:hypothetical protein
MAIFAIFSHTPRQVGGILYCSKRRQGRYVAETLEKHYEPVHLRVRVKVSGQSLARKPSGNVDTTVAYRRMRRRNDQNQEDRQSRTGGHAEEAEMLSSCKNFRRPCCRRLAPLDQKLCVPAFQRVCQYRVIGY